MIRRVLIGVSTLSLLTSLALADSGPAITETSNRVPGVFLRSVYARLSASDWNGIRQEYERNRYSALAVPGGYRARNFSQHWVTQFDGRGFEVEPEGSQWRWGLQLESYGWTGKQRAVQSPARMTADKERVSYDWDQNLREWWVNGELGLEHGFTVQKRLEGEGSQLELQLGVRGGLRAHAEGSGDALTFVDAAGAAVVNYSGLKVTDADGKLLVARMAASAAGIRLAVEDSGARYPLTIDPVAQQVYQEAYLKASDTKAGDQFGWSVAVSEDGRTVVVGAPGVLWTFPPPSTIFYGGQAYVFVKGDSGVWTQQAILHGDFQQVGSFGWSVAVSGNTIVVGAPGEYGTAGTAYIFLGTGGQWTSWKVLASNATYWDQFGWSVAVSGNTVVVGSWNIYSHHGAVYVFVPSPLGGWTQQNFLYGSTVEAPTVGTYYDEFGYSVAVSGDTVVIGAPLDSSQATGINGNANDTSTGTLFSGAAYVFVCAAGQCLQQAYLKASNTTGYSQFGRSVAISRDTVVVGAANESSNAFYSGAAYLFGRTGSAWSQQAVLKPPVVVEEAEFGASVSVSGNVVVVGAPGDHSGAIGVNGNQTDSSAPGSGAAYVFMGSGGQWIPFAYLKPSNTSGGDDFGSTVTVSVPAWGDPVVVVGAFGESSSATGVNGNQSNNSAPSAGAAYAFVLSSSVHSGDSNLDGTFNFADLNTLVDFLLLRTPLVQGSPAYINSDVNGDGRVGMADLNLYVDCLLGRISQFPAAPPAGSSTCPGRSNKPDLGNLGSPATTGSALSSPLRNNFGDFVGMKLTVGSSPLNISSLGRMCAPGNSQLHLVKLVDVSDGGIDVPAGSTSVNMASCTPGSFVYALLASPTTLPAGGSYYLVSQENLGGDQWYDYGGITTDSVVSVTNSVYFLGGTWNLIGAPNTSYGPLDFLYSVLPPASTPAFVINYDLNRAPLRNNFDGYVGMQFTVGPTPLNVSSLGRVCVAGNTATHTVKLVLASTGGDVPGGTVSVNMGGCSSGQFVYVTLPGGPVTLQANTAYYVASQETNGGDQWYDHGTLTTTSNAAVNNSIYFYSGSWIAIDSANTSYVPPNFQYSLLGGSLHAVQVTVQTNIAGPSFTVDGTPYTTPQIFVWVAGAQHTIGTTSPQSFAADSRYNWTGWSDGGGTSHTVSPPANITYTASFSKQFLLTASVSPASSGTVTPLPTSALGDGYYDSGTPVQLTAATASGNTFLNWSGDLAGTVNPQSVVMSAPHSVTANFLSAGATSGFVTTYNLNNRPLRNNFTGWVGLNLTVGGNSLSVTSVGRLCVAGNSGTHVVKFVNAATGMDVAGGSASLNMATCIPGQFLYGALASPLTLAAGGSYYLVSQELLGGDQWYDYSTLTSTSVAAVNSSVYSFDGASWIPVDGPNTSYVPPDFQYSVVPLAPNTPFVISYNLNDKPLRNDFTGWVGMKLTAGASDITINSLGRIFVAGNSGTHTIKLVRASDGVDVPGGSVSLSMAGGTPGQFSYTSLGSSVILPANTSYYLVSQELLGGDQWYDYGTVSTTSAGSVNNAVYWNGASWVLVDGANSSYVPPNFR